MAARAVATGWVSNPRNAGGARSDILFAILDALRAEGLHLSPPATTFVTQGGLGVLGPGGDTGERPATPPFTS